jgi:(p)ppGpp synthase/HD superfamily hydrolase
MLIDKAREISLSIHGNQTDKLGIPYFAHVVDVSKRVAHLGNDYAIVGLLHDSVEDAAPENQNVLEEEIKEFFNQNVAYAIDCITKRKPPRYDLKEDYFEEYLPRLITSDIARSVKIADSSHNLSKAHLIEDGALQAKLRNKYIQVLDYLGVDGKSCEKPLVYRENQWIELGGFT